MSRRATLSLLVGLSLADGGALASEAVAQIDADNPSDMSTLVQRFIDIAAALPAYQVVMTKQQRIGDDMAETETVLLKHQRDPECRYFKWIEKPHKNREAIYCAQRYKGKIQIHEPLLLGFTVSVDPDGALARRGNLRPIQQSGIYNMAHMLQLAAAQREKLHAPLPDSVERDVDGLASLCLRSELPGENSATYPVGAGELCFDRQRALPTEARFWHRDGRLMEDYHFRNWMLDSRLGDADFDTDNRDYGF